MQRNMQCDVTWCTVTSTPHLGILCLASGRCEDTFFTGKSIEQTSSDTEERRSVHASCSFSNTNVSGKTETKQEFLS